MRSKNDIFLESSKTCKKYFLSFYDGVGDGVSKGWNDIYGLTKKNMIYWFE